MVTLRKRKEAPVEAAAPATKKQAGAKKGAIKKALDEVKEKVADKLSGAKAKGSAAAAATNGAKAGAPQAGDTIDVAGFGGELETHDGRTVTLQQLLADSKAGVVLFTYPKANTPGCTTQACLFRDGHDTLSSTGLSIYGLSGDSPKSNTTFKTKQKLTYDLLCNPTYGLIGAIGMQDKPAKKTKRGVFVVDKQGKVLVATKGGPQATVDAVREAVEKLGAGGAGGEEKMEEENKEEEKKEEDEKAAETAGEVADASEEAKLDEPAKA